MTEPEAIISAGAGFAHGAWPGRLQQLAHRGAKRNDGLRSHNALSPGETVHVPLAEAGSALKTGSHPGLRCASAWAKLGASPSGSAVTSSAPMLRKEPKADNSQEID